MKKLILALSFIPVLLSCNRDKKSLDRHERENDSLKMVIYQKNHAITGYRESFHEIESRLDSINRREHMLILRVESATDLRGSVIDEINGNIKGINAILESNKRTITLLNQKLTSSEKEKEELKSEIAELNNKLYKKEQELSKLNNRLSDLGVGVDMLQTVIGFLTVSNNALAETVVEETEMLHTAFYICGSKKKLKDLGIVSEQGG
ncbi:MAG: hypothetical protein K0S12_1724, partial [Bacteroidetes bacterium]|nr:hypothetical protein [Bacteroidota bacterium]